jgi:glycine cleavage system regulatory protein
MTDLVLTLIGQDRPGLIEAVATIVRGSGGNWLESRMTRLGGKFAGILRAQLPAENVPGALRALSALEGRGLKVVAETEPPSAEGERAGGVHMNLEVVGVDRPGIVREITQLLAAAEVNVEELETDRRSAPMSGEILFEARAVVRVPPSTDLAALRAELERAAKDLVVDVRLEAADPKERSAR